MPHASSGGLCASLLLDEPSVGVDCVPLMDDVAEFNDVLFTGYCALFFLHKTSFKLLNHCAFYCYRVWVKRPKTHRG